MVLGLAGAAALTAEGVRGEDKTTMAARQLPSSLCLADFRMINLLFLMRGYRVWQTLLFWLRCTISWRKTSCFNSSLQTNIPASYLFCEVFKVISAFIYYKILVFFLVFIACKNELAVNK